MGRTKMAARNIAFAYVGQIATALMTFILKTIFIHILGDTLNGVNGLYTSILTLLSMAELGIGTALNFALYAPVDRGDKEKIKSYMQLYRKAYHTIGFVVAVIGLILVPFLKYLIKNPLGQTERDLIQYYLIFLFNTVSTYFVSYKYSLVNAEQKNYIQTNINTLTKLIVVFCQIIILLTTKNFYAFLLTDAAIQLIQKFFVNAYLNKLYPYLLEKDVQPLTHDESNVIWSKTKALVLHKVGDAARLQTDALIISSFIEVSVSGKVDNYTQVITTISNFVNIIFNSVISSFGNLIATESKKKQYETFQIYRFAAAWFYGFSATGFLVLLSPLIQLWLGESRLLPALAISLLLTDYYFKGDRIVLSNFKTAAGVFEQDKYLAIIQGIVNLILSITLVQVIGLAGIYVGTVVSGLIANVTKPFIIYHVCFDKKVTTYFIDTIKYAITVFGVFAVCKLISIKILANLSIPTFILMGIIITILFNGTFILLFRKTNEFNYMKNLFMKKIKK
jgi:O-antigen/teichoic acid export membrane protein